MTISSLGPQPTLNIESLNCGKIIWTYIERPTPKEVEYLAQNYQFHPLNLDDVVSRVQRPKIDEYDDHLFIVLHFPVFNKANRVTTPSEVDIFISEGYLITVHKSGDLKPLSQFFKECQNDGDTCSRYMSRSSGFLLYHILDRLVNYCFPILNKLLDNTDKIEDLIFARPVPETVREISLLRRDLISFRRIVHPQIPVVEALEREEYTFLKEDQDVYFGDIADHIRKIWDGLEDCKEVVDGLADTSNWLTSHRIQEVMRVLTIVMAIMAPATLIASIYGMNIHLPGGVELEKEPTLLPLVILLLIMAGIAVSMVLFFRRRHWL
ncbi:MAG: magnesium transporter CorA family protein [Chloroflexi bacterium]|nr:magnesium transporter CorA family protein [Chloroflexota bacterium]